MDLTEDIAPVTALSRAAPDLITRAAEGRRPIVITQNGRATAVLQDVASYERQRRALQLLKVLAQGDRDHDVEGVQDTASVDAAIRDRLAAHRDQA